MTQSNPNPNPNPDPNPSSGSESVRENVASLNNLPDMLLKPAALIAACGIATVQAAKIQVYCNNFLAYIFMAAVGLFAISSLVASLKMFMTAAELFFLNPSSLDFFPLDGSNFRIYQYLFSSSLLFFHVG